MRGAALPVPIGGTGCPGRSPRARGSLEHGNLDEHWRWSIPACAGQSCCCSPACRCIRVDPRVRGAVSRRSSDFRAPPGRSPRARGSHGDAKTQPLEEGSIPACAGQSPHRIVLLLRREVDPRVRGAVLGSSAAIALVAGRSPRARGSPPRKRAKVHSPRSIPACAGQSCRRRCWRCGNGVDPRVRGAVTA